ncbi:hypothetical protein DUI87_00219 [Hirundo rustica rustica]|uniref:Uncharacterized protein n=1 Tax=Hirundo rustica rustica TaxID=333673 RepID=A0A3M0LC68_HIRRU|nr:hypothetical protein DUI87_00219 [Hirundo rustica rustica]
MMFQIPRPGIQDCPILAWGDPNSQTWIQDSSILASDDDDPISQTWIQDSSIPAWDDVPDSQIWMQDSSIPVWDDVPNSRPGSTTAPSWLGMIQFPDLDPRQLHPGWDDVPNSQIWIQDSSILAWGDPNSQIWIHDSSILASYDVPNSRSGSRTAPSWLGMMFQVPRPGSRTAPSSSG